jgi:hypothetical protein
LTLLWCRSDPPMRARADLPVPAKPASEIPHLVGHGLRERILMTLAVNDRPLYVTEMAALLGVWHSKIDQTLVPLERVGVVSSTFAREQPAVGSPFNPAWPALNPAWPAHPQALRLFRRLEEHWPSRTSASRRRAERVALSQLRPNPGSPAALPPPTVWRRATPPVVPFVESTYRSSCTL